MLESLTDLLDLLGLLVLVAAAVVLAWGFHPALGLLTAGLGLLGVSWLVDARGRGRKQ